MVAAISQLSQGGPETMATNNSLLQRETNKHIEVQQQKQQQPTASKIHIDRETKWYVRLDNEADTGGSSNRGLGKFHQIVEAYFDTDNRLFVRYRTRNKANGSSPYAYAVIGKLQLRQQQQEQEEAAN